MLIRKAIASAGFLLALGLPAHADAVLYSNGNPVGPSVYGGYTSSVDPPDTADWTATIIYEAFTLTAPAEVTGFSYDSDFVIPELFGGMSSPADYVGTNWSILAPPSSPASPPMTLACLTCQGSVNIASPAVSLSVDSIGYTTTTVSQLNIVLSAGTYWIGMQNVVDSEFVTPVYIGSNNTATGALASQLYTAYDVANYYTTGLQAGVFSIRGVVLPGVPELPTWALMLLGFGGLGVAAYRQGPKAARRLAKG